MQHKKIMLEEGNENAYIETYIADQIEGFVRDAVLVIPGGGYHNVCSEREGEPIAMAFLAQGYNAFVLHYSVAGVSDKTFPAQLKEASLAIKHIKNHASEYGINKNRVFAVGFSAGGHLAASLGVLWNNKEVNDAIDMPYGYNKPTGVMLIYPVISDVGHAGSFKNLFHTEIPTEDQLDKACIDRNVTKDASPAFMLHTVDDAVVNVENTLSLANAYTKAGVPYELHIYPSGPHGVALGNEITKCGNPGWENAAIAKWVENAVFWAKNL